MCRMLSLFPQREFGLAGAGDLHGDRSGGRRRGGVGREDGRDLIPARPRKGQADPARTGRGRALIRMTGETVKIGRRAFL